MNPDPNYAPAPWSMTPFESGYKIKDANEVEVAVLYPGPYVFSAIRANAKLIAAAPDLLQALQLCAHWMENIADDKDCAMIQEAIKKATV